jgi:hypothetical protein
MDEEKLTLRVLEALTRSLYGERLTLTLTLTDLFPLLEGHIFGRLERQARTGYFLIRGPKDECCLPAVW